MKYRNIASDLFIENRRRLAAELEGNAFAVVHSADIPWRSADGSMRFIQNSDLFYLTGIDQEETILVLYPNHPDPDKREILFVRETSELLAIWEGHKATREEATSLSGIAHVEWTTGFDTVLRDFARRAHTIYLNFNEHARSAAPINFSLDDRFRQRCQLLYPNHRYERLAPILHRLRSAKSEIEVELIRAACDITAAGFERVLRFVRPGVMEYEIEAEFLHEFVRRGSRGFAYEPIIASGTNANILHYLSNDQACADGDLLLMDVAAEYACYNSDLTRTIPVNGRFTPRQRALYEAVHRILRLCIDSLAVPGKPIRQVYQREAARAIEEELIALGLIDAAEVEKERKEEDLPEEKRAYRKYFMHGVSHSLGLDVHDVAPVDACFVEGMVVTVEPGIYIREEGIAVRLENDIVVRESGNIDLMAGIPVVPEEIEDIMASGKS